MDDELQKLDEIRRRTGVSMAEAKAALDAAGGDLVQALLKVEAAHPRPAGGGGGAPGQPVSIDLGDGRIAAAVAHGGAFVGLPILVPLVLYFLSSTHPFVRHHATQALVWHVSAMIAALVLAVTIILSPLVFIVLLVGAIFSVIAILRAIQGEHYEYPLVGSLAKKL